MAVGHQALATVTTADQNVAIGRGTLFNNTAANQTAVGHSAMYENTTGTGNTAFGYNALYNNTTAAYNTAVGHQALHDANRTADVNAYNTAVGYLAGNTGTNDVTTGDQNVLIGASTAASQASASNQIVIGYGASGHGDNIAVIGNGSLTAIHPSDDNEVDLGSSTKEFKDLYMGGDLTIGGATKGINTTSGSNVAHDEASGTTLSANNNRRGKYTLTTNAIINKEKESATFTVQNNTVTADDIVIMSCTNDKKIAVHTLNVSSTGWDFFIVSWQSSPLQTDLDLELNFIVIQ